MTNAMAGVSEFRNRAKFQPGEFLCVEDGSTYDGEWSNGRREGR